MNIIIRKQKQRAKVVTQTSDIIGREAPSLHPAPLHFVHEPLKHKLNTIDLCILLETKYCKQKEKKSL